MLNLRYSRKRGGHKLVLRTVLALAGALWILSNFVSLSDFYGTYAANNVTAPEVPPPPQPRIGKVTIIYGGHSIYEDALVSHRNHSEKFGYPMTVLRSPILDDVWNKPAIILSRLLQEMEKPKDKRLEWLFWFDGDTVLMNPNVPLETFLPPPTWPDTHLLLTKDFNGLNNGVFFVRVHPWSIRLFSAVVSYPIVKPGADLGYRDQAALGYLLKEHDYFHQGVIYYPQQWFNAYRRGKDGSALDPGLPENCQIRPGDLLVHFAGVLVLGQNLTEAMTPYIEITEQHRPDWEVPLSETHYMEEIGRFWYDAHNKRMSGQQALLSQ